MNNHFSNDLIYQLQYLEASIGKLIAMLSKYPTLNLTLNYHQILKQIVLIQIQPDSFDIRNLIQMRDEKDQLEKKVLKKEGYHIRCGHSLACEFYLISPLILKVVDLLKENHFVEEGIEYLTTLNTYVLLCGQYVNQSFLVDELIY